jgi:uncharacterized protein YjbI with pentapeptide repeats
VEGADYSDVLLALREKLRRGDLRSTLLLGELGAGKTATLSLLYVEIANLFLSRKLKAIPIFIRLRDDWKPEEVEESLLRYIDAEILHRLIKKNVQLVLLLDSLDEFAFKYGHPLTLRQIADNVLHSPFLKKCIVIISTRPNVISDIERLQNYRDIFPNQYQLHELQFADVQKYVNSYGLKQTYRSLSPQVRRLLNKPLFLYFFVTGLKDADAPDLRRIDFTDEVQLYDWFFQEWYERERIRIGLTNQLPDIKYIRQLLEAIAVARASNPASSSLTEEEIENAVNEFVTNIGQRRLLLNNIFGQVRERMLLVPKLEGGSKEYQFINPSIADYFLSGPLAASYLDNKPSSALRLSRYGDLVLLFVKARLNKRDDLGQILRAKIGVLQNASGSFTDIEAAISIVFWLEYGADTLQLEPTEQEWLQREWKRLEKKSGSGPAIAIREAIRRVRLSGATLTDLFLLGYNLSQNSDLSQATLTNCTFTGGEILFNLSSVNLEGAVLRDCRFIGGVKLLELFDATLSRATFENCKFVSCNLSQGKAIKCKFVQCRFSECDLSKIDFSDTSFSEVMFEDCLLVGATMSRCTAQKMTLRRCNLNEVSITGFNRQGVSLEDCKNIPPQW